MKKTKIYAGLITCGMILSASVGVYAGSNLQTIQAYLNGEVKFKLHGEDWTPTNDKGQAMLPITYNNSTYIPLRSVSNALNTMIDYDANRNLVLIGSKANIHKPLTEVTYTNDQKKLINDTLADFESSFNLYIPTKVVEGDAFGEAFSSDDSVHIVFNHLAISQSPNDYYADVEAEEVKLSNNTTAKWIEFEGVGSLTFKLGDTYIDLWSEDDSLSKEQILNIAASMTAISTNK